MRSLALTFAALILCGATADGVEVPLITVDDGAVVEIPTAGGEPASCVLELFSGRDVFWFGWTYHDKVIYGAIIHPGWQFAVSRISLRVRLFLDGTSLGHKDDGSPEPYLSFEGWKGGAYTNFTYPIQRYLADAQRLDVTFLDHIAPPMSFSLRSMPVLMQGLRRCWSNIKWADPDDGQLPEVDG